MSIETLKEYNARLAVFLAEGLKNMHSKDDVAWTLVQLLQEWEELEE